MPKISEIQPCPICGGSHPPGACPQEAVLEEPKKELMSERDELENSLKYELSSGNIFSAQKIIALAKEKKIDLDFVKSEISFACQKGLELYLSQDTTHRTLYCTLKIIVFAEQKGIALNFSRLDIASACQKNLEKLLLSTISWAEEFITLAEQGNITLDTVSACQKSLEVYLSQGKIDVARSIIALAERKSIALDFSKPEIASAYQKELERCLFAADISSAQEITVFAERKGINLDFSKSEIITVCQRKLEDFLSKGWFRDVQKVIDLAKQGNISLDVASAFRKGIEAHLFNGWIFSIQDIISFVTQKGITFDITEPWFVFACQNGLKGHLLNNNIETAMEINHLFLHFSLEKVSSLYSHHLQKLLSILGEKAPQLVSQCQKSIELFFSFFAFRNNPEQLISTLEANPFLSNALETNPRFGPKLLLKYSNFDDVSKSKIRFLFENKKEILQDSPDIDSESLEFRQKMQQKLFAFERNQEIVEELKKVGVDTVKWLNYKETEYFTLKSGEELVSFSERVRTPLDRLGQTIGSYAYQIKNILAEWREDLLKLEIEPASVEDDRARIKQMESELEKANAAGDDKKAHGLDRGLETMRKNVDQAKKISIWNRLMSEIDNFAKLKEILSKSQEALILIEQKYEELASSKIPSGAELSKIKSQIAQAKEDFRKRLEQMERRLENFRTDFPILISGLGKDRAVSLEQELNEKMTEQFTHYDSDRQILESLFSEKADKEKEKLENRPMSVFVWARNPDIDLYQGNFSPCCICIESAHMGAESTIADYATDLGIQIVNVWDEQKNEPVAAAWCWLGKDENGKTALVVDNIEANTTYSSNFSIELWSELKDYLEMYAQAIGVNRLVLGKNNNDLPIASELAKLPEASAQYFKLGGQNGRPNGYFLEAEESSVKLLWEKARIEIEVKKEKKPTLEIKEVQIESLTQANFGKIIDLERRIYQEDIVRGSAMIDDLMENNGLDYSVAIFGQRPNQTQQEFLGYLVAYNDETDEGEFCVYLDDIAVVPDCQGTGLGWSILKAAIERIKIQAKKQGKPILFDMHLKLGSQSLFEKHSDDLKELGVILRESSLVPNYYDEGEDALYCVYEVVGE